VRGRPLGDRGLQAIHISLDRDLCTCPPVEREHAPGSEATDPDWYRTTRTTGIWGRFQAVGLTLKRARGLYSVIGF